MVRAIILSILSIVTVAVGAETVTVCAAVSLKEAMTDAGRAYEKESGDKIEFVFGASGALEAQIKNGAPADAFISAADQQIKALIAAKLADESSRRVVAENSLVLIVPPDKTDGPKDLTGLTDDGVKKIAIGDPKIVPAGQYAAQSLKAANIDAKIADKLVYGANVRQVLAYVERGEVDAGIVYATDAREAGKKVRVAATIDDSTHDRIEYPAIILRNAAHPGEARKFLEFLATDKAKAIFQDKGFKPAKRESKP